MRIVYITDLHGSLQPLGSLLGRTKADLYIVAGDLLKGAFRSSRNFFRFQELTQRFSLRQCRYRGEVVTRVFVESRLAAKDSDREERRRAREYLRLHDQARQTMEHYFLAMEEIFSSFPEKRIFVLPGNYDMNLTTTALKERDLHRRVRSVNGLRIAGYGGARGDTPGIPEDLKVHFREQTVSGRLVSEPRDFFSEARPDVAVLHMPPFGLLDVLRSYGNLGSVGVREYVDDCSPPVVLCGHMHENWGVVRQGRTIVANPSNFGTIPNILGMRGGGYFFDFIMDGPSYQVGTLRQFQRGRLYDVVDYPLRKDGSLRSLVVDPDRLRIMGHEKAVVRKGLRQIRDFKRVRDFFRRYETEESRKRIEGLRQVYRELKGRGEDVAFDVLGSVNFGMSEPGSDVDLVVYRRCPCGEAFPDSCPMPRALSACFQGLGKSYKIDVTDCVNLNKVEDSIRDGDADCPALQRFVLYRSICSPINLRLIRETENLLLEKPGLRKKVEYLLKDYLHLLVLSHSHIMSFKKYESRLQAQGARIPVGIEDKLRAYLGFGG
jgi:uncharacterized protein